MIMERHDSGLRCWAGHWAPRGRTGRSSAASRHRPATLSFTGNGSTVSPGSTLSWKSMILRPNSGGWSRSARHLSARPRVGGHWSRPAACRSAWSGPSSTRIVQRRSDPPGGAAGWLRSPSIRPPHAHDREVQFWREATGWRFAPSEHESFAGKLYPAPGAPLQLLLQRLAADDRAPAVRAHLDLGCDDREAEAARLVALGAERLWSGDGWITLRDPAGLLFCATGTSPDSP